MKNWIILLFIVFNYTLSAENSNIQNKWFTFSSTVPDIPVKKGVAGTFSGVDNNVLIVAGDYSNAWVRGDGYNSLETDLAIAMDHMILAAASEGVGTCWIAAFNPFVLRNVLGLKDSEQVFAITPLGYPEKGFKDEKRKSRKPFDAVVGWL